MVRKPHRLADPAPDGVPRHHAGTLPISQLPEKGRVTCQGRVESVTFLPADQAAAFSAMVSDAEPRNASAQPGGRRARLRVVWLGRRRVPGIEAGAEIRLDGMLSTNNGLTTMFNPRYEIMSRQENE